MFNKYALLYISISIRHIRGLGVREDVYLGGGKQLIWGGGGLGGCEIHLNLQPGPPQVFLDLEIGLKSPTLAKKA